MGVAAFGRSLSLAVVLALVPMFPAAADTSADARERRQSISIRSDTDFGPAQGVRSGTGTPSDPYVISGWDVDRIELKDTSAHVIIRDNLVRSQLILNWNGPGVTVVGNDVWNLRVNENVRRTGDATSGLIARNRIGLVGQLRHFDGIFERNLVDPGDDWWRQISRNLPFTSWLAVAFDGFNGARFRHNEIHGPVRVQLHGHHHSSSHDEGSHHHGSHGHDTDHSQRYHRVSITNNVIYSYLPYALMYTDIAHSANDRTAASEDNSALNGQHVHYTRVVMNDNRLIGAGLVVDIFNADDRNHTGTASGRVEIIGNEVTMHDPARPLDSKYAAIDVQRAKDLLLKIERNRIIGPGVDGAVVERALRGSRHESGIRMDVIDNATIYLFDNYVLDARYGIEARRFNQVTWWLDDLRTERVREAVTHDNSSGPPREGRP